MAEYKTSYIVHVCTGDCFGAGTDANVYLQLFGPNGQTDALKLTYNNETRLDTRRDLVNKFERGRMDKFVFRDLPSVGKINEVQIWHDNSGLAPSWMLEYIEISDPALRLTFRFPYHKWLKKTSTQDTTCACLKCTETFRGPGSIFQPATGVAKQSRGPSLPVTETEIRQKAETARLYGMAMGTLRLSFMKNDPEETCSSMVVQQNQINVVVRGRSLPM